MTTEELMGPGFFVFFTVPGQGGPSDDGDGGQRLKYRMYEENLMAVILSVVEVINEQT